MGHVQRHFSISERRACRALGQSRSSQRYTSAKPHRDRALVERMKALASQHPPYGTGEFMLFLYAKAGGSTGSGCSGCGELKG